MLDFSLREENLFSSKSADDRRIFRSRNMEIAVGNIYAVGLLKNRRLKIIQKLQKIQ